MLNHANGEKYSGFNQLQHKVVQKSHDLKG